jgi:hypothetical protein
MKIDCQRGECVRSFASEIAALLLVAGGWSATLEARPDTREEGLALAAKLRASPPAEDFKWAGIFEVRDRARKFTEIQVQLEVKNEAGGWRSTYDATLTNGGFREQLVVLHSGLEAPRFLLARAPLDQALGKPIEVASDQLYQAFARTDFSLLDLGLDFFHWPLQTVVSNDMRRGQPCKVLESLPDKVVPGGYSRVHSWVVSESGGIVNAKAWDEQKKLLKEFSVQKVGQAKARGRYEVKTMEIRNVQTGSRTRLILDLDKSGPAPANLSPPEIPKNDP